ncbi:MAG: DUF4424 domain-containing protein [Xanthobacteraceae bacterium]
MRVLTITLALAAMLAAPARGNDSSAELSTGGLIFVRNDDIEMLSEDLAISTREVTVRYRFHNKAVRDVTILVAFPMPDIHVEAPDDIVTVPTEDPVNFLAFTTIVNGQPVTTKLEQRVLAAGVDRTQMLRDLGIPLAPHLAATNQALDRLPAEQWEELLRLGIAEIEEYDTGRGMIKHLTARWTLQTTYYWEQTFPASADTIVEHRYQPSVGASVQTSLGSPDAAKEPWFEDYKSKYCLQPDFLAAVERERKAANSKFGAPLAEERIDYILKTGAHWSGPIKEFRLTVDKGAAENLISFCGEDVKPVGQTKMEMDKTDYVPDGNLSILILKKMQQ